jgi:NAD(P)-dependent dehydrogenase (short-subunit alcohol dehydrogenase family)
MTAFTLRDIPDQTGRRAVVTGATGGLGYETAQALAGAGAEVVLAGRDPAKGAAALARILDRHPGARVRFAPLDLASLGSVAACAADLAARDEPVDLLVNNAGVMALPARRTTADGFELQFGTNYLGHFALTARLLPLLHRASRPRVVNVSSIVHHRGAIAFDDLQAKRAYVPWGAYAQSKLAMLIFARELQRRSEAQGWGLTSLAAHPGWARTDLFANGPGAAGGWALRRSLMRLAMPFLSQSAAAGALPILFAATASGVVPGGYYGSVGFRELKGPPGLAAVAAEACDPAVAARLWEVSEALTGVRFPAAG